MATRLDDEKGGEAGAEAQGQSVFWFAGIVGGLQGVVAVSIFHGLLGSYASLSVLLFFVVCGCLLQFIWFPGISRPALLCCLGAGVFWAVSAWWTVLGISEGLDGVSIIVLFSALVSAFILGPFIQAGPGKRTWTVLYPDLFEKSWNNIFIIITACLFSIVVWAMLALCAMLFKLIHIDVVSRVLWSTDFSLFYLPFSFGMGVGIGRDRVRVLKALKSVAVLLSCFFQPLSAVISVIFLFFMFVNGVQVLWDTDFAFILVVILQVVIVCAFNGVYQDGLYKTGNAVRKICVSSALLVLPVYSCLALAAIWLRTDQYGLTPSRVWGWCVGIVLAFYGLGYLFGQMMSWSGKGESWYGKVNVVAAILVVVLLGALNLPLMDPYSLSAENQYDRLVNGKINPILFDVEYVRDELGKPGKRILKRLEAEIEPLVRRGVLNERQAVKLKMEMGQDAGDEDYGANLERTRRVEKKKNRLMNRMLTADMIEMIGEGVFPEGLLPLLKIHWLKMQPVYSGSSVLIVAVNLDDDSEQEYLFWVQNTGRGALLFDRNNEGGWEYIGKYLFPAETNMVRDAMKAGLLGKYASKYGDIGFNGWKGQSGLHLNQKYSLRAPVQDEKNMNLGTNTN